MCVTRGRPNLLRRATRCFQRQSYARRELLIVYEDDDPATKSLVRQLEWEDSRVIGLCVPMRPHKISLGELRNIAVDHSSGDFVAQWDDDDWYSNHRLEVQWDAIAGSGRPACVLGRWTVFDTRSQLAYLSMWRTWEGSLLCRRSEMLERRYPDLPRAEDTPAVDALQRNGKLTMINRPDVYVYVFHNNNTWPAQHFSGFFQPDRRLADQRSKEIAQHLSEC